MKVLFLPHFPDNPYQRLLRQASTGIGVRMQPVRVPWFLFQVLRQRPDLVHIHWLHPFYLGKTSARSLAVFVLFLLQWPLLRLLGVPITWTVHNLHDHEGRMPLAERTVTRLVSTAARRIIVHCETARSRLRVECPWIDAARTVVVPHGSYFGVYPNTVTQESARQQLGLPPDARVVLFFGEVRRYKGILDLAELFAEPEVTRSARLVVAGRVHDPALRDQLAQAVRLTNSIHLHLGYVADVDVQLFMSAADIVATPFRDVLTSGSLILGMSFGKAVIAPKVGCAADLAHSTDGWFYDPADPQGLATALHDAVLHTTREDTKMMGERNRKLAEDQRWSAIAHQTRRVYEHVIRND